jgi:hypothetical protein
MADALELPLRLGSGLGVDHFRVRSRAQTRVVSRRVKKVCMTGANASVNAQKIFL